MINHGEGTEMMNGAITNGKDRSVKFHKRHFSAFSL